MTATAACTYKSEFARRYFAQGEEAGEAIGQATAVLVVLEAHGVVVGDAKREAITSCTDLAQFTEWLRRAATGDPLPELAG